MGIKGIKVLVIEDNPADAELIEERLSEATRDLFGTERVQSLAEGLERIDRGGIDAILLDLGLPDSQGLDTYTRINAESSGMPVIVLTNVNDEEKAVAAIRQGAQDYLFKGEIDAGLLSRSIRYAIERNREMTMRKEAEKELRHREAYFRALIERSSDFMAVVNSDGSIRYENPSVQKILGYNPADRAGGHAFDNIHPDDVQKAAGLLAEIMEKPALQHLWSCASSIGMDHGGSSKGLAAIL
jgi:CheY-like chemotaxis protein